MPGEKDVAKAEEPARGGLSVTLGALIPQHGQFAVARIASSMLARRSADTASAPQPHLSETGKTKTI